MLLLQWVLPPAWLYLIGNFRKTEDTFYSCLRCFFWGEGAGGAEVSLLTKSHPRAEGVESKVKEQSMLCLFLTLASEV